MHVPGSNLQRANATPDHLQVSALSFGTYVIEEGKKEEEKKLLHVDRPGIAPGLSAIKQRMPEPSASLQSAFLFSHCLRSRGPWSSQVALQRGCILSIRHG